MASLGPVLQSLGLMLVVIEDPSARDKTLACREPFDATNRRVGNKCNPRKEKPMKDKSHLSEAGREALKDQIPEIRRGVLEAASRPSGVEPKVIAKPVRRIGPADAGKP